MLGNLLTQFNEVRLNRALGYITPLDKVAGRDTEVFASHGSQFEAARANRLGEGLRSLVEAIMRTVLM